MLNVSERSVKSAQAVVRSGAPALVQMVETGSASVSAAAEVAKTIREDATVLERLEAGDPETVATVRAQIMDVVQNPAPRASRSGKNPDYQPHPRDPSRIGLG